MKIIELLGTYSSSVRLFWLILVAKVVAQTIYWT